MLGASAQTSEPAMYSEIAITSVKRRPRMSLILPYSAVMAVLAIR
jgi:hypothetical protein